MPRPRFRDTIKAFQSLAKPQLGGKRYDAIIVGSGSAGSTLALRLSEDPKRKVLLIEAGPQDRLPWIHIPVGYFKSINNPKYDWMYKTDPATTGLANRSLAWPRGKVLGGSSCLNGLLYIRGVASDFDSWARELQDPAWSYQNVLPRFRRSEDAEFEDASVHGHGGQLSVSRMRFESDLAERWMRATAETCAVPRVDDLSSVMDDPDSKGCGVAYFPTTTTPEGFRSSSALALHEVRDSRPNLDILVNAHVSKVLLESGRAVGVSLHEGCPSKLWFGRTAYASDASQARLADGGEVLLAAGAMGSPHLLMASGVGDRRDLERAGFDCLHHLPGVGGNLQDHLQLRPKFRVNADTLNTKVNQFTVRGLVGQAMAGLEFALKQTGPAAMAASQACALVPSPCPREGGPDPRPKGSPELQFHFQPLSTSGTPAVNLDPWDAITMSVCILRPESRGRLTLAPSGEMVVSPDYLSTPYDQQLAVESIQVARRVAAHPALQELGAEEVRDPLDDPADQIGYVRKVAETIYHPAGTCKMGLGEDAVVDPRLKVHGLENLRVVDCSVMPTITSGNTHAPTVMIAEMASDFIRGS